MKKPITMFLIFLLMTATASEKPLFTFCIFSDNTGDGTEKPEFRRMYEWIRENDPEFIIGLGDHVKKRTGNKFLELLKSDSAFTEKFYPVIADGENEFYGKSQKDWGAGGQFLKEIGLYDRKNVTIRDNGCEYHAVIECRGIKVHFISLHYPDQPADDSKAFRQSSREYITNEVEKINKDSAALVIAGAHSRLGYWFDRLDRTMRNIVSPKTDLVLSATTHIFHIFSGEGYEGPLTVNTGSITRPRLWSPPGFIKAEVYEDPLRIRIEYLDCRKEDPAAKNPYYRAEKILGGKVKRN